MNYGTGLAVGMAMGHGGSMSINETWLMVMIMIYLCIYVFGHFAWSMRIEFKNVRRIEKILFYISVWGQPIFWFVFALYKYIITK